MPGFYEGSDLANKTFYGFRLIERTGDLNVDVIAGDGVVSLPENGYIIGQNEYKTWVWSTSTYQFRWGAKGHLEMVFV